MLVAGNVATFVPLAGPHAPAEGIMLEAIGDEHLAVSLDVIHPDVKDSEQYQ